MPKETDSTSPNEITLPQIWGAVCTLLERTKCLPELVTKADCAATRAKQEAIDLKAALNGNRGVAAQKVAARFTIRVALISALASAIFTGAVVAAVSLIGKGPG